MSKHTPTEINLNRRTRILTVNFGGESFDYSCEYVWKQTSQLLIH